MFSASDSGFKFPILEQIGGVDRSIIWHMYHDKGDNISQSRSNLKKEEVFERGLDHINQIISL